MSFISMWISVNIEYSAGGKGTAEEAGPPKAFRMIISSCYPAQTGRFLLAAGLPGSSLWHKSKHCSSFCVRTPSERWELFLVSSVSAERSTRLPIPGIWLMKKEKKKEKMSCAVGVEGCDQSQRDSLAAVSQEGKLSTVPWDPLPPHKNNIAWVTGEDTMGCCPRLSRIENKQIFFLKQRLNWLVSLGCEWRKDHKEAEAAVSQDVIQAELITPHQVASFSCGTTQIHLIVGMDGIVPA